MEYLYKVMIVEKQTQMVHIYKNMLPWEEYRFQIASVTDQEDKALAYFGEYKHELIVTDIDLKAGNGISLIRQIKQLDGQSHIIVITAHDDYDTIREAFKAGADDVLLKSRIRYSSLAQVLKEVVIQIDRRDGTHDEPEWQEKVEKMLGLIRDEQKIDEGMLISLLDRPELAMLHQPYRMLYFRMDNVRMFNRTMKRYDKPSWMSTDEFIDMFRNKLVMRDELQIKLRQIVTSIFYDCPEHELIFTKKHSGLILVPDGDKTILKEKLRQLIGITKEVLTYDFSSTISRRAEALSQFLPIYEETIDYHHHKFYDGNQSLEDVDEAKQYQTLDLHQIHYHERIVKDLAMQEYDDVSQLSQDALNYMVINHIDPKQVKEYFEMIIEHIEIMAKGKNLQKEYPFAVLRQGIQETENVVILRSELEKIFDKIMEWLKDGMVSKYHKNVERMLEFIQGHLNQKISLAMVADAVSLSEIHAGRIFKREMGQGVIEYINEQKMHLATEYMKHKEIKIKEVAAKVGMEDQFYFNRVFKKVYGISPREYRKQN